MMRSMRVSGCRASLPLVMVYRVHVPSELPFGSLSLAQFETERLLEKCLHRNGGAVYYGWNFIGFEEHADGIRAEVEGPDANRKTIDCRWLVGCNGAHSKVRSALGIDFQGERYPQTFVLADLEVEWDLPRGRLYRFNHGASGGRGSTSLVAVPVHSSRRRYRLSTILPDREEKAQIEIGEGFPPNLTEIIGLMTPLLPKGTLLSSLHWSSVYHVSHRLAASYGRG